MKAAFALGALAALCQSVISLREGTYTIGSPSLEASLVLGETKLVHLGYSPLNMVSAYEQTSLSTMNSTNFKNCTSITSYR